MTSGAAPYTENRYALERRRASVGLPAHARGRADVRARIRVPGRVAVGFDRTGARVGADGGVRHEPRAAFALRGRGKPSPAVKPAKFVLAIVALAFFNPTGNTLAASAAQIAMYVAILGPLFWVPRLSIDISNLRRVLLMIWIFQSISAVVGILQVYFPGHFAPAISTIILNQGRAYVKGLQYQNAYGQLVFRAMGLSDIPGGAGSAGFYAALFGAAFMLTWRKWPAPDACDWDDGSGPGSDFSVSRASVAGDVGHLRGRADRRPGHQARQGSRDLAAHGAGTKPEP